jgi:hypothetical protein
MSMTPDNLASTSKTAIVQAKFRGLVGLQLFKSWNVFATRLFYFAFPGSVTRGDDGEFVLSLECPWRIEKLDQILVGSEDYGTRARSNSDEAWKPDMQWGHPQDEKLKELLGKEEKGEILSTRSDLIVESVEVDAVGAFRLQLSGGYNLATFPSTGDEMEWLLKQRNGRYLILMNGNLHGSLL